MMNPSAKKKELVNQHERQSNRAHKSQAIDKAIDAWNLLKSSLKLQKDTIQSLGKQKVFILSGIQITVSSHLIFSSKGKQRQPENLNHKKKSNKAKL